MAADNGMEVLVLLVVQEEVVLVHLLVLELVVLQLQSKVLLEVMDLLVAHSVEVEVVVLVLLVIMVALVQQMVTVEMEFNLLS